jgi:hypothetical protein
MKATTTVLGVILLTTGCAPTTAVVDGRTVPRPTFGYTDHRFFSVKHENAYPEVRGPSGGLHSYGGRLSGRVCSVDLTLESEYWGRRLDISGFATSALPGRRSQLPVRFDVRDGRQGRVILGSIGDHVNPVEIHLTRDAIHADIGWRRYTLDQLDVANDELRGTVHMVSWYGQDIDEPFVVRGMSRLWAMPAADQAAVLPFMMSCLSGMPGRDRYLEPVLGIDFTGG